MYRNIQKYIPNYTNIQKYTKNMYMYMYSKNIFFKPLKLHTQTIAYLDRKIKAGEIHCFIIRTKMTIRQRVVITKVTKVARV